MLSKTHFEKSLCQKTRLFSISKTEADIFLLLQAGTITYEQLHTTGLHGKTAASGRLSLKRLEKNGLAQSRTIAAFNQTKYYYLTTKGKNYAKQFFPSFIYDDYLISQDQHIPCGHQQLIHRIRANDFFFSYIGYGQSVPLAWQLEAPLTSHICSTSASPRCDGLLSSKYVQYFIEQDNNTQSEAVLLQKIKQYQQAGILSPHTSEKTLVFCLAFPKKQHTCQKPSYSTYKILLRLTKLWKILEDEHALRMDFQQFLDVLDSSSIRPSISEGELQSFSCIHILHPDADSLDELLALKKRYLDDTAYLEHQRKELDTLYLKRLKSHFSRFYEANPTLLAHAYSGNSIFAIPNHRIGLFQPYIMHHEHNTGDYLMRSLMYNGLLINGWEFNTAISIDQLPLPGFSMPMGFQHRILGYIFFELYPVDLSSIHRLRYFINNITSPPKTVVIILLGYKNVNTTIQELANHAKSKNIDFLFAPNIADYSTGLPLRFFRVSAPQTTITFECDDFCELLRIIPAEEEPIC